MKISGIRIAALSILTILSLLTPSYSKAESRNSEFVNITYLNGLTTNSIYDVCTDKNGCLWIGTATGLSKYNGYNVKNFFKEEMNIRSNIIKYLLCDRNNRIWVGSGNGVGIYDSNSKKFLNLEVLSGNTVENKTAGLFEDSMGTIWISLRTGGIRSIDPDTFETTKYFSDLDGYNYFFRMWFEPENDLYLAAAVDGGLYYLDLANEIKTPFSPSDDPSSVPFADKKINGLTKVNGTSFCLSCEDGTLWLVNPYEKTYEQLPLKSKDGNPYKLRKVSVIGDNILGIGHTNGLVIYDLNKRKPVYKRITHALENKNVYSICGNLENGLIIGTFKDGVMIQQESGFSFSTIKEDIKNKKVSLKGSNVTGFAESNDTTIWISTSLKGLFRYSSTDKTLRKYESRSIPKEIDKIAYFSDRLWICSSSGLYSLNPDTKEVRPYREGFWGNSNIIVTEDNRLILLTENRLLEFNESLDNFTPVKEFKDLNVLGLGESDCNTLVAITKEKGLVRWKNGKVTSINHGPFKNESLSNYSTIIFEDSQSRIWAAPPETGVLMLSENSFNSITTRSGLASDVITNAIKDNNGNILITTDRSLSKITESGKIYSITKSDGLINYGFTRSSAFKTSTGDVFLGSRDGVTIIHSTARKAQQKTTATDIIEKIVCNGTDIQFKNKVVLKHNQNSFDITISDIDPYHIVSGRSLYCLEGYENTWKPAGKDRKLSYQGLKPGKYTFKSYNPEAEAISIRINAHPLVSVTAIAIYVIALIILMTFIIIYIRNNEVRKRKEKTIQMKVDLHQDKIDFFTNIAHEIKTPLTLITTPLNHLKNNPNIDEEARYDIDVMDKHASYLSSLIKELLEFSKLEKSKMQINSKPLDFCRLVSNIVANYKELNDSVKWSVCVPDSPIWIMADNSATSKILNNLIFNAIKYTESFINIEITCDTDNYATFTISNDGDVIPSEMREKIFDSFVQYNSDRNTGFSKEGFGIGLSVAKTLAILQEGKLYMGNSLETNDFILKLPITDAVEMEAATEDEHHEEIEKINADDSRNTILVAEDHPDLLEYIRKTLSQNYNVLTARNGAEAYEMVKSQSNIDLIITDLKMPEMTGMELCRNIKQNPTFSHILVVILSANLTPEIKIESLKGGADAIIEKPFSMDFLLSRVENLINARKILIERYSGNSIESDNKVDTETDVTGLAMRDIVFLKDLNRIIQENFNDPDFGVDELAEALNLSRSSLNRKMRDILNDTANNHIRETRMAKAEELLRNSTMQINEICYKVGFQTPSYFIKCFRKKFGMSPNEYANSKY